MTTMTFDSIACVRMLEECGFTRQQAETQTEVLRRQTEVQARQTEAREEALRERLEATHESGNHPRGVGCGGFWRVCLYRDQARLDQVRRPAACVPPPGAAFLLPPLSPPCGLALAAIMAGGFGWRGC